MPRVLKGRSSNPEKFCKTGALRNFVKFTEITCARVYFSIKLLASAIKTETLAQMFSYEFCKISKNNFSYRMLRVVASEKVNL